MDLTARDRALLVGDVLVVADCHLGKGPASNLELPVGDAGDVLDRFEALLDAHDPAAVVIAGDLLHSFRTVPRTVERTVADLAALAEAYDAPITVTPGNHDTMLDAVWEGETTPTHRVGDTVVCHGHVEPEADAERYVIGHDHPTIEIEGQRRPCFLTAPDAYRGADVVMLPAFNRLLRGVEVSDMRANDFQSPLIRTVDDFQPVVRDEDAGETLTFPPLGEFRELL